MENLTTQRKRKNGSGALEFACENALNGYPIKSLDYYLVRELQSASGADLYLFGQSYIQWASVPFLVACPG